MGGTLPEEGQYLAQADETCTAIAKRLGLSAAELVRLNKDRYPGLRPHAKVTRMLLLRQQLGAGAPAGPAARAAVPARRRARARAPADVGT